MKKFLSAIVAGFLFGSAGTALAHDMAGMTMAATAPAAAQTAAAPPDTINIDNFSFGPDIMTIAVGTTVTWVNHDDEPHTVVSGDNPRLFKSSALDSDDKFTFKFEKPGTYKYFCSIHPHMTGTIVVK
jgi:plastocyanin